MPEDFDIDSLAAYLHLDPLKVNRLVTRGKIPGRKVGGEWKFSHAEIHHWLEERMGVYTEEELVKLESALERAHVDEGQEYTLSALLPPPAVAVPLAARTRNSVIHAMVELAAGTGLLWDPAKMEEAVKEREELYPTAMEGGVALLHPRRPLSGILAEPFVAFGKTLQGIPFGSQDGGLTDLFFLICSTDDRGHLRTLARLSRLFAIPGFLSELRDTEDPVAARELILQREHELD